MPRSSIEVVRKRGYTAEDVREIGLRGATDDGIIAHAAEEGQIVVTRDTDFGQVLRHPAHPGALILRLPYTFTADQLNAKLGEFLDTVEDRELVGAIVIIELGRYRRRPIS